MLMPTPQSPDDRGHRWLQAQVQEILAANAVALATPGSEGESSCYWGTGPEASTTLYLRLAGDPAPQALHFPRILIADCGAGKYVRQGDARMLIRRTLTKMGILSA